MKVFILAILCFALLSFSNQVQSKKKTKKYSISRSVNSFGNKTYAELIPDSEGKIQTELPSGKYLLTEEDRQNTTYNKL